MNKEDHIIMIQ